MTIQLGIVRPKGVIWYASDSDPIKSTEDIKQNMSELFFLSPFKLNSTPSQHQLTVHAV